MVDSDDDEDIAPAQEPSAPGAEAQPSSKQLTKRKTVLDEDSDSDDDEAPKKTAGVYAHQCSVDTDLCEAQIETSVAVFALYCWERLMKGRTPP